MDNYRCKRAHKSAALCTDDHFLGVTKMIEIGEED